MPQENYDRLLNLVKQRRTVRRFKPDPVPEGCIEKIIEVARWAPSGISHATLGVRGCEKERGEGSYH